MTTDIIDSAPSRSARKAAATREAIIDAAQALLAQDGAAALTLPAVSERADVAVQTVYNRVGGRDALLLAVAERALEANCKYMEEAYAGPGTPLERLQRAGAAYARFAMECPDQFRLITAPPDEPQALERIAELIAELNGKLADTIREGIADGSIRPDIDPGQTALVLWALMNAVLGLGWRHDRLRAEPGTLLPLLTTIIELGIIPRP